jgi:hypothetical protein
MCEKINIPFSESGEWDIYFEGLLMMRNILIIGLLSFVLLSVACNTEYKPSAEQFFKGYLNLQPIPPGISDFSGTSQDTFPVLFSKGHVKYRASSSFFEFLVKHDRFFTTNPSNDQVHLVRCDRIYYGASSIDDELNQINFENKICYEGTFIPYKHIIIYDPTTQLVDHLFYAIGD